MSEENKVHPVACKGENCKAVDGVNHSIECRVEHDAAAYYGAGSRHPECRYRGYKNEPLEKGATADQEAAWHEGSKARESNSAPKGETA